MQSDEVVHEGDLPEIRQRCEELLHDKSIEGLLFKYRHFWGDYDHYITSHAWYANEIRIIRNHPDIHSWESAQSFRRIPDFDGIQYRKKEGTYKLKVARVDAYIYHYGWVRPPHYMQNKRKAMEVIHQGQQQADARFSLEKPKFDYGDLSLLTVFKDTHPAVMWERMRLFNWADQLNYGRKLANRPKHERMKYRILTFIEQHLLGGRQIFSFRNYRLK